MTGQTRHCCYIAPDGAGLRCSAPAEYEIWHGTGIEDNTDSCAAHIADLLTDATEHRLFKIARPLAATTAADS